MKFAFLASIAMTILLNLFNHTCNGQEEFATYENAFGKTYDIEIAIKNESDFKLYIQGQSLDKIYTTAGISIDEKQYNDFIKTLNDARLKFEEWINTAKQNNVKSLTKEMALKCKAMGFFKSMREWHFHFGLKVYFLFQVIERNNGEAFYALSITTREMTSSSNQYISCDGVAIVFSSPEAVDSFISSISKEKIIEFYKKPKTTELFKD